MAGDTRERIMEAAIRLFARNGYPGTSMSDIAAQLGITKPALYKHYAAKQEILDRIVERMDELDRERAEKYHMPQCDEENFGEIYANTPADRIRQYSIVQFRHWTEEEFSSCFRKMLTLEQYRSPEMAALYHRYLGAEPLAYMAEIFRIRVCGRAASACTALCRLFSRSPRLLPSATTARLIRNPPGTG